MRVLVTGMSGTGKSTLVGELQRRGLAAYDADDGFSVAAEAGRWRWDVEKVSALLAERAGSFVLFAGCSDEQRAFDWQLTIVLTAPEPVLRERLRARAGHSYGKSAAELAQILEDRARVEPLLRAAADVVITTTVAPERVADLIIQAARARFPSLA